MSEGVAWPFLEHGWASRVFTLGITSAYQMPQPFAEYVHVGGNWPFLGGEQRVCMKAIWSAVARGKKGHDTVFCGHSRENFVPANPGAAQSGVAPLSPLFAAALHKSSCMRWVARDSGVEGLLFRAKYG